MIYGDNLIKINPNTTNGSSDAKKRHEMRKRKNRKPVSIQTTDGSKCHAEEVA
jgi:hypothetical protein